jgi:hypothetical protein
MFSGLLSSKESSLTVAELTDDLKRNRKFTQKIIIYNPRKLLFNALKIAR